jgi:hypothetical protein
MGMGWGKGCSSTLKLWSLWFFLPVYYYYGKKGTSGLKKIIDDQNGQEHAVMVFCLVGS